MVEADQQQPSEACLHKNNYALREVVTEVKYPTKQRSQNTTYSHIEAFARLYKLIKSSDKVAEIEQVLQRIDASLDTSQHAAAEKEKKTSP